MSCVIEKFNIYTCAKANKPSIYENSYIRLFLKGMAVLCDIGKGSKALDILGSVEHILRSVKLLTVHALSSVVEFLVVTAH